MLTAGRIAGALVLLKDVDVVVRGPANQPVAWALALALLAAGGGLLLAGRDRPAWALVLGGCGAAAVDLPAELVWQHTVLLALVALTAVVSRDEAERRLLWRVQVSALYGVAALAKLNEPYLAGSVLGAAVQDAPLGTGLLPLPPLGVLVAASAGLLVAELLLAAAPWVPRLAAPALVLATTFHVVAVPMAGATPLVALRLVIFGGTALVLIAAATGRLPVRGGH